jgi:CHAT domain-containing protein
MSWFGRKKKPETAAMPIPEAPGAREATPDLSSLGSGATSSPDSTAKLIEGMSELVPFLGPLLSAPTLAEQIAIAEAHLPPERFGSLFIQLSTIEFFYEAKDKKTRQALALAELRYELAKRMPTGIADEKDVDHSRSRNIADALAAMGGANQSLGSTAKALEYHREAEKYYVQDQEDRSARDLPVMNEWDRLVLGHAGIAEFYNNLGKLYRELGDEANARECWLKTRQYETGNLTPAAKFRRALSAGGAAENAGDFDAALGAYHDALDEALAALKDTLITRDPATACHHIGETMARLGLHRRALWYHRQAHQLNANSRHLERQHFDHMAIGRIYRKKPRYGDALSEFVAALQCVSIEGSAGDLFAWSVGDSVFRVLNPDLAWQPALEIGQLHREAGRFDQTRLFLQLSIDLSEAARTAVLEDRYRIKVQSGRAQAYAAMVSLHAMLALSCTTGNDVHSRLTFEYAERARGRAFLDSLGASPIAMPDSIPEDLRSNEAALLDQLRALRDQSAGEKTVWDEYAHTRERLQALWERIRVCSPEAADYVAIRRGQPIEWDGLAALLLEGSETGAEARQPDTAPVLREFLPSAERAILAEYIDTGDEFLLLLARPGDRQPKIIPLPLSRQLIEESVRTFLPIGIDQPWQGINMAALQKALQPLIDPVVDASARDDLLWFVPYGALHRVPLHAFTVNGEPLIERNAVCYSPSASVMKYCRTNRHPGQGGALMVADSRRDMELPYGREQASALQSYFAGRLQVLSGENATRSRLYRSLSSAGNFEIVHFVCHGVFNQADPLASGILLAPEEDSDSVLTAREILGLRFPADLVTLGACESGLSETLVGEELLGLTRAFLYAGAAAVAVSIWAVNDISTSITMSHFYREMAAGVGQAEALRRAVNQLRRMSLEQAIAYCRQAQTRNNTKSSLLEEDIADFEFRARDFAAAFSRYSTLRASFKADTPDFHRISVALSRCRLALKSPSPPDYSIQPFSHPYHWAPFSVVGSWSRR